MRKKNRVSSIVRFATWGVTAAAIVQELRKPGSERTWHGRVAGFVPYDFRFPTIGRMRASWWSPDDDRILTEQVFGVGWSVNFGRVARLLQS